MAAVIKHAAEAGGVRSLAAPVRRMVEAPDPRDEALATLRAGTARLEAELAEVRRAAADAADQLRDEHEVAVERAREEAYSEGHRAGAATVETREGERAAILGAGLAAEVERFGERLVALDGIAAALARACLDRVFARPEAMAMMVAAALERHMATLRDHSALAVRVSGADFSDTGTLEAAARAGGARATVTIDPDLPAGACRIAARLGHVDLDVPAQWAALARLLDTMAGV